MLILLGIVVRFISKTATRDALDASFSSVQEFNTNKAVGYATKSEFYVTSFVNLDESSKYNLAGFSSISDFELSGFSSLEEASQYKSIGFDTKDSYEKSGFSSIEEAKKHINAGFSSKTAFEESGFLNFDEAKEFRDAGYPSKHKFLTTGFIDLKQAVALQSYGSTHDEAVAARSKVSLAEFKSCDRAGGSTYKNECLGKDVIWYAKIDRYAGSGSYLDVVENCADNSSNSKSA